MSLYQKYQEVLPKIKEEFGIKNSLAAPQVVKVVINAGVAEAITNKDVLDKVKEQLSVISGQMPKIATAKKSISSFKLKEKDPIGVTVTLRGKRAWNFLQKFIAIVMPRMRDFRGLSKDKFDHAGNYSIGLSEQILFPEIDYAKIDKIRGLVVTINIKNSDPQKSQKLLELLGAPFRKEST
jgi:large subunit ribosomal protein L5